MTYNSANWYWYVGGNQTRAFSSAAGNYVPATDTAFVAWLNAGGVPTNIDTETNLSDVLAVYGIAGPIPVVPKQVTSMQAKVALSRAGLLTQVQTWVNGQSAETQLIWNSATVFQRNSTLINTAAVALGLTPAQVDQLFITAATINP